MNLLLSLIIFLASLLAGTPADTRTACRRHSISSPPVLGTTRSPVTKQSRFFFVCGSLFSYSTTSADCSNDKKQIFYFPLPLANFFFFFGSFRFPVHFSPFVPHFFLFSFSFFFFFEQELVPLFHSLSMLAIPPPAGESEA